MIPGELYTRLGVLPDATPQQIHRAYRKAAKTAHPDVGGSKEEWAAILEAYETLHDDRRRRIYDDTGEVEAGAADNHYAQRLIHIATAMDEVAAQSPSFDRVDWISAIRQVLHSRIRQCRQGVVDMGSRARDWDAVARRATVPAGEVNVLRGLAEGKAGECRRRAAEAQQHIEQYEESLALIAHATCRPGQPPVFPQLPGLHALTGLSGERMW